MVGEQRSGAAQRGGGSSRGAGGGGGGGGGRSANGGGDGKPDRDTREVKRVWLGGVMPKLSEQTLLQVAERYGEVEKVDVGFPGIAFVLYRDEDSAQECVSKLHQTRCDLCGEGRTVTVQMASVIGYKEACRKREMALNNRRNDRPNGGTTGRREPPPKPPPPPAGLRVDDDAWDHRGRRRTNQRHSSRRRRPRTSSRTRGSGRASPRGSDRKRHRTRGRANSSASGSPRRQEAAAAAVAGKLIVNGAGGGSRGASPAGSEANDRVRDRRSRSSRRSRSGSRRSRRSRSGSRSRSKQRASSSSCSRSRARRSRSSRRRSRSRRRSSTGRSSGSGSRSSGQRSRSRRSDITVAKAPDATLKTTPGASGAAAEAAAPHAESGQISAKVCKPEEPAEAAHREQTDDVGGEPRSKAPPPVPPAPAVDAPELPALPDPLAIFGDGFGDAAGFGGGPFGSTLEAPTLGAAPVLAASPAFDPALAPSADADRSEIQSGAVTNSTQVVADSVSALPPQSEVVASQRPHVEPPCTGIPVDATNAPAQEEPAVTACETAASQAADASGAVAAPLASSAPSVCLQEAVPVSIPQVSPAPSVQSEQHVPLQRQQLPQHPPPFDRGPPPSFPPSSGMTFGAPIASDAIVPVTPWQTHPHSIFPGFLPSMTSQPPATAEIIDVALVFNGRKKLVRHLSSTRAGEIVDLHPSLQQLFRRPLVITDRDGFEIGREMPIGHLLAARSNSGDGGGNSGPLELILQPDDWAE